MKKSAKSLIVQWALMRMMGPDRWTFSSLNDSAKNELYSEAIRAAGGLKVVDLGTECGLYAMLACRHGAQKVVRCEPLIPLKKVEERMLAANGLDERVAVVTLFSQASETEPTEAKDDEDDDNDEPNLKHVSLLLEGTADTVILGLSCPNVFTGVHQGILQHGLLHSLDLLSRSPELYNEATKWIPNNIIIYGAAVELYPQTEVVTSRLDSVSAFDLRYFSDFQGKHSDAVCMGEVRYRMLTKPFQILQISPKDILVAHESIGSEDTLHFQVQLCESGICHAIIFWHECQLDATHHVSYAPTSISNRQNIQILPNPMELAVASTLDITFTIAENSSAAQHVVDTGLQSTNHVHVTAVPTAGERTVQKWHFPMLNDLERNTMYEKAIETTIRQYKEQDGGGSPAVLDIGAGSGLLSMMAVRHGADHVVACEKVAQVAAVASTIVDINGYAQNIKIVPKLSSRLSVGDALDLEHPVDIVVSEIMDCGLLGEGMLPALVHAAKFLAKPKATFVPASATVYALPIQCFPQARPVSCHLGPENGVSGVMGFDFSEMDQFRSPSYEQIRLASLEYSRLTEEFQVFDFELGNARNIPTVRKRQIHLEILPEHHDVPLLYCHAVVFWFNLQLAVGMEQLTTHPTNSGTCWKQAVQHLPKPLVIRPGQHLLIKAKHDSTRISFKCIAVD